MNPLLDIRIVFSLIIFAVIGYFAWNYHEMELKIKTDQGTIQVQNQAIAIQKQDAQETTQTDKITDTTQLKLTTDTTAIQTKQQNVQNTVQQKVNQIESSAIGKPDTPALEKQLDDQVAAVDIDGMWQTYCDAEPNATGCPTTPAVSTEVTPEPQKPGTSILDNFPKLNFPTIEAPKLPEIHPSDLLDKVL